MDYLLPRKLRWFAENHKIFGKEIHIPNLHFWVRKVNSSGAKPSLHMKENRRTHCCNRGHTARPTNKKGLNCPATNGGSAFSWRSDMIWMDFLVFSVFSAFVLYTLFLHVCHQKLLIKSWHQNDVNQPQFIQFHQLVKSRSFTRVKQLKSTSC